MEIITKISSGMASGGVHSLVERTIRMISSDVSIETGQYPVSKQSLNPSVSECDFSSVAYLCPFLGQRI
jgi:hypothetical protein